MPSKTTAVWEAIYIDEPSLSHKALLRRFLLIRSQGTIMGLVPEDNSFSNGFADGRSVATSLTNNRVLETITNFIDDLRYSPTITIIKLHAHSMPTLPPLKDQFPSGSSCSKRLKKKSGTQTCSFDSFIMRQKPV